MLPYTPFVCCRRPDIKSSPIDPKNLFYITIDSRIPDQQEGDADVCDAFLGSIEFVRLELPINVAAEVDCAADYHVSVIAFDSGMRVV